MATVETLWDLYEARRYRSAAEVGESLLGNYLSSADEEDAYLMTCYALCATGRVSKAEALVANRAEPWATYIRAHCAHDRGHTIEVGEYLKELDGKFKQEIGQLYEQLLSHDETIADWPKKPTTQPPTTSFGLVDVGTAEDFQDVVAAIDFYRENGNRDLELRLARDLASRSESLFHHIPLVWALDRNDHRREIAIAWEAAIRVAPNSFMAHMYAAVNLQKSRRFGDCDRLLNQAVALAPSPKCRSFAETGIRMNKILKRLPFLVPKSKS